MQVWEDGQAFKDVHAKLRALAEQRESIEAARKATKRRLPLPGQALPADPGAAAAGGVLHPDDWVVQVGVRPCWLAGWRQAAEAAGQTRGYLCAAVDDAGLSIWSPLHLYMPITRLLSLSLAASPCLPASHLLLFHLTLNVALGKLHCCVC